MWQREQPVQFVIYNGGEAPDTWVRDVSAVHGVSIVQIWGETHPETLLVEVAPRRAQAELRRKLAAIDPRLAMSPVRSDQALN